MTNLTALTAGLTTVIPSSGESIQVANTTMGSLGGVIINPLSAQDQGVTSPESLYVSLIGRATTQEGISTRLLPGQWFLVPPNSNVWATARTAGHRFTAFFTTAFTVPYPPMVTPGQPGSGVAALAAEPGTGEFPPSGVTGLTTVIPSYLYQEYSDDDDCQGFVDAQNEMQQNYVDTFNALNLPIYTGPIVAGPLLDWVGQGVYGMSRPALGSGLPNQMGPLNTYGANWLVPMWSLPVSATLEAEFGLNEIQQLEPTNVVITNDDIYRRILTWHFYKGDGKYFNVRWLKRRVWRFLYGYNGRSPEWVDDPYSDTPPEDVQAADSDDAFIADTKQISVSLGVNRNVTIRFVLGKRTIEGGALINFLGCNGFNPATAKTPPWTIWEGGVTMNDLEGPYTPYPPLPNMSLFKEALDSGDLEIPYQYNFTCNIG